MRYQERFDADGGRRIDDLTQLGVHRDFEVRSLATVSLSLIDR